jgi:arylformamidase
MTRRIWDISPLIDERLQVWPGDTPPSREVLLDIARGDNLTLSTLRGTVHLGAHADAPSHYGADAPTIERRDLGPYLGPCTVIDVDARRGTRIGPEAIDGRDLEPRVLFRTGSFDPRATPFQEDFVALEPALVDALHRRGVRLCGLDTPSVDLFASKELPAHHAFLAHDMAILEGLVLDDVEPGTYELVALPLKLAGFDASPVRAVLRELDGSAHG